MVTTIASFKTYQKDLTEAAGKEALQVYNLYSEIINFLIFRERRKDETTLGVRIWEKFERPLKGAVAVARSNYHYEKDKSWGVITVEDKAYLGALQHIAENMEKKGYKMTVVK